MVRKFEEKQLVIASHNAGKIAEIQEMLTPHAIKVINGGGFELEEPEENAATFTGNAEIKSRYFAEHTGLPSLSDDSGLVVPALNGAPGIYSARWAGEKKDFYAAIERVRKELLAETGSTEGQKAYFVCVLSLCWPDGHVENFEGQVHGTLTFPPRGDKGFGYDPIFIAEGHTRTFAEMEPAKKHSMSHRANAFIKLIENCFAD